MRQVTIAGGGIAGLMLGIILRRGNVPVRILEAGDYPRHKVCGEFISGRGLKVLQDFHLFDSLLQRGARTSRSIRFHSNGRAVRGWDSPAPALAVSRFTLDELLARTFTEAGGDLVTGCRWRESDGEEGVVRATGRRIGTDRQWRWIGLKAHAQLEPNADLEMHFTGLGYAGVARLGKGRANVCALLRTRGPLPGLNRAWPAILARMVGRHDVQWDASSFCSVAGFSFHPAKRAPGECSLGDAMAMIPPLTGNGMSIALESAALAAEPLMTYSRGGLGWDDACRQVEGRLNSHFRERLRWAGAVQNLVFTRPGQWLLRALVMRSGAILPLLFERTR